MIILLFWISASFILYSYLGFPLLVWLRSLLVRCGYQEKDIEPKISMIIIAHNEQAAIGEKIQNILNLDYPVEQLEVMIGSDGSDDRTNDIVSGFANRGVRLLALPRRGKIATLNATVAKASGDVLVFSDANSMFARDALRQLVRPLADQSVGGVAGDQRYVKETADGSSGERAYWNLDRQMKRLQSRSGSTISATGAIYAIRRELFQPVPSSVTDDFMVSTGVIEQGYRLVFARDAAAYEPPAKASGIEFGRKVRIGTRGLRAVIARRRLLNPLRFGFYSLQLVSHKVCRRLVAIPLCVLLVASLVASSQGMMYQLAATLQLAFYACGLFGLLLEGSRVGKFKLFALPAYFTVVNAAMLVALANVLVGRRIDVWQPKRSTVAPTVSTGERGVS